jgi:RNA exonuclease 4
VTKAVAIDCEMVGVGENGKDSIIARVSIVNQFSDCIYDKYVIPTEKVTDYRTSVSGIRPDDLKKENGALPFSRVQKEVADILKDRILVGHAVHNDLQVLFLSHSKKKIRDTQKCKVFRRLHSSLGGFSSLKNLAKLLLGITIQEGEHSSVIDAQVTMRLYTMYKKEWEADLHNRTVKTTENKLAKNVESEKIVKNGVLQAKDASMDIKSGNQTHKKYLINKLRKRNSFIKKFKK